MEIHHIQNSLPNVLSPCICWSCAHPNGFIKLRVLQQSFEGDLQTSLTTSSFQFLPCWKTRVSRGYLVWGQLVTGSAPPAWWMERTPTAWRPSSARWIRFILSCVTRAWTLRLSFRSSNSSSTWSVLWPLTTCSCGKMPALGAQACSSGERDAHASMRRLRGPDTGWEQDTRQVSSRWNPHLTVGPCQYVTQIITFLLIGKFHPAETTTW